MDTRSLFQQISKKMHADFEISAQIRHSGTKGTARENVLREFLKAGRLPYKYAIGSGEVVGRVKDTSRQCDLIIYDRENGVTLLRDESVQVYPIDCVYGIVEVKSSLSKAELLDSLEKIKALKEMKPHGAINKAMGSGWTMFHSRPRPFGMVFAYALAQNSLNSLEQNLAEWERANPPSSWPNYICVLDEGTIFHHGKPFETCIDSDTITEGSWPISICYAEDSLFQFYCALHDACAHMALGPVELMRYYEPAFRIGKYLVDGRVELGLINQGVETQARISEKAIEKIVTWCKAHGKLTWKDTLLKRFGCLPAGMENTPNINAKVYFYNPENLPGFHELGENALTINESGQPVLTEKCLAHTVQLIIDGESYEVPLASLDVPDDFDLLPSTTA